MYQYIWNVYLKKKSVFQMVIIDRLAEDAMTKMTKWKTKTRVI